MKDVFVHKKEVVTVRFCCLNSVNVGFIFISITIVLLLISWLTSVAYSVPGRRRGIGYRWWDGGGVGMSRACCGDNYTGMK